ncbi:SPFH domain / Band 7 family protein [Rhizobiales bacterium GAS113]|nr:SPFH domain / Band 7 family protein [Rhizobiales bacterium GAS113]
MIYVVIVILALIAAIVAPRFMPGALPGLGGAHGIAIARVLLLLLALTAILETSIVKIPANEVGVVRKLYGASNLADGQLIATNGETGYQAQVIPPGTFRISPFFNVLNTLDYLPLVTVPQGFYGRVVARDGAPLPAGQVMADAWPEKDFQKFLDAEYFLTHGGQKGLQLSVLKPGVYPLNLALFEVKIGFIKNGKDVVANNDEIYNLQGLTKEETPLDTSITRVPAGSVGVVRSSVQAKGIDCATITAKTDAEGLAADLVPQGCKGIWADSLSPNDYYLNRDAYDVTLVSTRVTALEFKGGFTRRYIDLKVDSKGDFTQSERTQSFTKPNDSADSAINTKMEGWEIQQELRAVVQITPEHAPIVVAAVGGQSEVDDRIVVPSIRSHVRNVYGGTIQVEQLDDKGVRSVVTRPTRVLDTIEQRPVLEKAILERMQVDGRRAGVDVKEIRLGESVIPPELLLARQREQLAGQLKLAFIQEQTAQEQRQKTEQARATANQQSDLVTAQIGVQTAKLMQDKRAAEGRAERLYLEEQAAGQTAQANVLGKDSVLRLQQMKLVIDLLAAHPDILKNLNLPRIYVAGGGNGLEGAAAVFGGVFQDGAGAAAADVVKK